MPVRDDADVGANRALVGIGAAGFLVALASVQSGFAWATVPLVVFAILVFVGTFAPVVPALRRLPVVGAHAPHPVPPTPSVTEALAAAPATPAPERLFVSQTPKELADLFKQQTGILAQKQADVFYGKWMRVSGRVGSVRAWTGYSSQVTFDQKFLGPTVFMMFRDREVVENRLTVLREGDPITVVGEIERIDPISVQLTNCELTSDVPQQIASPAPERHPGAQTEDSRHPIFDQAPPGLADMTHTSLRELFASRTTAQAHELLGQYRGEPVRVSGEVTDVDLAGTPSVSLESAGTAVRLFFDAHDDHDARPLLLSLHNGDKIVVSGQSHGFAASTIAAHIGISIGLDKCKLLSTRRGRS